MRLRLLAILLSLMFPAALYGLGPSSLRSGLRLWTGKSSYLRYEMVDFRVLRKGSDLDPARIPLLAVRLRHGGGLKVDFLAGKERALLFFQPGCDCWMGSWPIPWNPPLGEYQAELLRPDPSKILLAYAGPAGNWEVPCDEQAEPVARTFFKVEGRAGMDLPPGFSVVTLEPGKTRYRDFPGVDGEKPSWFRLLEWTRFLHADAFWHAVASTQVWGKVDEKDFPWPSKDLAIAKLIAGEAKVQGIAYGAYAVAFRVEGDFEKIHSYTFTTGFDAASDALVKLRFISLDDPRRKSELAALLSRLDAIEGVTYLGLDYVRTNTGGLEFTDRFLADMAFKVPPELAQAKPEERQRWLGRLLSKDRDAVLENLWDWWRAQAVARTVADILAQASIRKPLWIFTLGWKSGHQHGQDNRMLVDAGASFTAPMFYELDQRQFEALRRDWKAYLSPSPGGSFVIGQPVDSRLLANDLGLNGPEEHFRRQVAALEDLRPFCGRLGLFWHDLNRALTGGRGPESMREWALAGAAAFSRLREREGVVPVRLEIGEDAHPGPLGVTFTVRVTNLCGQPLRLVRLDGVRTTGLSSYFPASLDVPRLRPGETREVSWMGTWSDKEVREKYRDQAADIRMLAVRARFPGQDSWRRPAFAFRYVGDRSRRVNTGAAPAVTPGEKAPPRPEAPW